jgi:hypothetical protein
MVAKVVAGACLVTLAALSDSGSVGERAHPVVVRASMPLPFSSELGHASFSATVGRTHLRFATIWSPEKDHTRLAVMFVSEPEEMTREAGTADAQ